MTARVLSFPDDDWPTVYQRFEDVARRQDAVASEDVRLLLARLVHLEREVEACRQTETSYLTVIASGQVHPEMAAICRRLLETKGAQDQ